MTNKYVKLDDKDHLILGVLRTHAKLSTQQIAKKTRIPITTVHNRIKKMESSGIIRGYTVVLDSALMGSVVSYVFIQVMYHMPDGKVIDQTELAKRVRKNESVEQVDIVTGAKDLIVKVRTKSIAELNDFVIKYLRNIQGIDKTETAVVLTSI